MAADRPMTRILCVSQASLWRHKSCSDGADAGSARAAQTAIWLRLAILSPLLPAVYADQVTPAQGKSLRQQMAEALLCLAIHPWVRQGCRSRPHPPQAVGAQAQTWGQQQLQGLFDWMTGLLQGLVSDSWPGWLKGDQVTRLLWPAVSRAASMQWQAALQAD